MQYLANVTSQKILGCCARLVLDHSLLLPLLGLQTLGQQLQTVEVYPGLLSTGHHHRDSQIPTCQYR
jgi:hypothetical protein